MSLLLVLLLAVSAVHARTHVVLNGERDPQNDDSPLLNETEQKNELSSPGSGISMKLLEIRGLLRHRYATMDVHAVLENNGDVAEEASFVLHLPESAFITRAALEAGGEKMEGEVRERKTAESEYQQALEAGSSAAHVATSVRDASEVRISVNVGPQAKAIFNLTYEELLVRRKGRYEVPINLNYEQLPELIRVEINVNESSNLTFIRVPPFNSSLTQDGKDEERENPDVLVERGDPCCARIFYETRGTTLPGPLLVRYDVEHTAPGGEVLMNDGYFVHFLATTPERIDAPPIPKHAIFVLDSSGSMWGRKLRQLKDAMSHILSHLRREDVFSVITFSSSAAEWSIQGLEPAAGRGVYSATRRNIALAQEFIDRMEASGATNIQSALRRALTLAWRYRNVTLAPGVSEGANYTTTTPVPTYDSNKPPPAQPVLVFLTDGMPTAGELRLNRILSVTKHANQIAKASIFALAFGEGANLGFLRKLSLQNGGFSRRIYEAADAQLQLQSFYEEVASPLLTNLTFVYVDSKVNMSTVTARHFPTYFAGTEAVVAGRLQTDEEGNWIEIPSPSFSIGQVSAQTSNNANNIFEKISLNLRKPVKSKNKRKRPGRLERAWAFLTIKQFLDAAALQDHQEDAITAPTPVPLPSTKKEGPRDKALALALKYGFVTPVTSLVMVAKNTTSGTVKETSVQIENVAGNDLESASIQDKDISAPPPRLPPGLNALPGRPGLSPGVGIPGRPGPSIPVLSTTQTVPPATQTVPPTTQTVPAATQTVPPATHTVSAASQTIPPATKTESPSTQTESPSTQTESPSTQTVPAANQTVPSATQNIPAANQTVLPATQTVPPVTQTAPPTTQTVPSVVAVTSTITPIAEADKFSWLNSRLQNGNQLSFSTSINPDEVIMRTVLEDFESQPEALAGEGAECVTKNGTLEISGSCRHLKSCSAPPLTFDNFLARFCDIQSKYVGVCCFPVLNPEDIY